ncbi:MAG: hypothetical protein ACHQ6V_13745 [Myxococcota bacterium]
MSTILKALKRLDEQRRADVPPRTLEEQVLAGGAPPRRDESGLRNKWRWAALGVAATLLAGAGAWYGPRERAEQPVPAPPAVAATPAATQPIDSPPAVAEPPRGSLPTRDRPVAGADLDPGVRGALRAEPARGAAVASALAAASEPESVAEVEAEPASRSAARTQVAAAPVPPRRSVQPAREPEPAAAPPAAPAHVASESPPARAEVPAERAAALAAEPAASVALAYPEVWVERTQWHPVPDKRSALVRVGDDAEAHELREGDALGGVVVKEIRPSGVLFLYEGHEFRRGVGGS